MSESRIKVTIPNDTHVSEKPVKKLSVKKPRFIVTAEGDVIDKKFAIKKSN